MFVYEYLDFGFWILDFCEHEITFVRLCIYMEIRYIMASLDTDPTIIKANDVCYTIEDERHIVADLCRYNI